MTEQCGTCVYYDPFHHRCAKRRLPAFLEAKACDRYKNPDDPTVEVVFRD